MDRDNDWPRLLAIFGVITGILAIAAGATIDWRAESRGAISSEVAGRLDPKIQQVARRLDDEPCNRTFETELFNSLLEHAEYGTIITFFARTEKKCGPNEEALATVFTAQMGSSDFLAAERTADRLIESYAINPNVYLWRAEAREKLNNFFGAYSDMRMTLSLIPEPSQGSLAAYYALARLAAKLGRPCEAAATLRDYIAFDPDKRSTQQLTTVMRDWQAQGPCDPIFGRGSALIHFDPNAPAIIVPVEVNETPARMIVDTGATRTVLSKQFADRAGVEASGAPGASVITALGKTWLPGGRARRIALNGACLTDVPVFIESTADGSFGSNVDGLLGLSFLGNFRVHIGSGVLQLQSGGSAQ